RSMMMSHLVLLIKSISRQSFPVSFRTLLELALTVPVCQLLIMLNGRNSLICSRVYRALPLRIMPPSKTTMFQVKFLSTLQAELSLQFRRLMSTTISFSVRLLKRCTCSLMHNDCAENERSCFLR
ncbi:hypothetical protein V3C99_017901, partial [Haemonchus contortus]